MSTRVPGGLLALSDDEVGHAGHGECDETAFGRVDVSVPYQVSAIDGEVRSAFLPQTGHEFGH